MSGSFDPDHEPQENDPIHSAQREVREQSGDGSASRQAGRQFDSDPLARTLDDLSGDTDDDTSLSIDVSIPKSFGRYIIIRELGRGGFGFVYLARDNELQRDVAVKVLNRMSNATGQERFLAEARRLARLEHPGIVTVHDVGVEQQQCYIVSSFVAGEDLEQWLSKFKPPWQQAAEITADIADALAHAHAQSTIHRDIKPANIILTADGRPVLVDFGLAVTDDDDPSEFLGSVSGTPAFMSPEQAIGRAHTVDGRTDIYSLGVVLYRMLSGRRPFRGKTFDSLARQICQDAPQPPRQLDPTIPAALEQICLRAMAKDPAYRFTTAADLACELRRVLQDPSASAPGAEMPAAAPMPEPIPIEEPTTAASDSFGSVRRRPREAERRQVTVLFCSLDVESSEEFTELDVEEQHEFLSSFAGLCDRVAAQFEAAVVPTTGDERLICFGYPVAHEDAAQRAVHAGLRILQEVEARSGSFQKRFGLSLPALATIHTALSVVSENDDSSGTSISLTGEARNLAVRVASLAEPATLTITGATHRMVRGYFESSSCGVHKIKGSATPVELFHVTAAARARTRIEATESAGLTPLVGRDTEVAVLKDRWEDAVDGSGQIVLLIGEAGLGKSRLVHVIREFVREEDDHDPLIIEWRCSPYQSGNGLYSATDYFQTSLGFERDDSAEEKLDRLVEHLTALGVGSLNESVALLASMLSLPCEDRYPAPALTPQAMKERTLEALLEWLIRSASKRPVLFILEDLHWVDPSTLEFLELVIDRTANEHILTVLTFRPEFETPWGSRANQSQIALHRLRRRQIAEMMKLKTGLRKLPEFVIDQIVERTDGIPLFVEEFTRMVQESGGLRESERGVEVTASFSVQGIPATLQDLLMARLDRMNSDPQVAQVGAVIGREFSYELLNDVCEFDETVLQEELAKLVRAEVLFERGRPPESSYTFKHALIQDAAYASLLKKTRQHWHLRIAESLEAHSAETVESQPGLLAHHFTEGNRIDKGIEYWLKAGQRSQARSEVGEAINHLSRGLELVRSLDESPQRDGMELGFLLPLGTMIVMARGYANDGVGEAFAYAQELCRRIGPEAPLFHVTWGIWVWRIVRNEQLLVRDLALQLMKLAEASQDDGVSMEAVFTLGVSHLYRGEFPDAIKRLEESESLYDAERCAMHAKFTGQNSGSCTLVYLALAYWASGFPDRALQTARNGIARAKTVNDPFSLAFALYHFGWALHYLRMGEEILQSADECCKLSAEQGFPLWEALGTLNLGAGPLLQGTLSGPESDAAFLQFKDGLDAFHATGAALHTTHCYALLANLLVQAGRLEDAERELQTGFETSARCGELCDEAELYRIQGELLLKQSPANEAAAEAAFDRSMEIAEQQAALSWQLRTAMSVARLRQQQDRIEEGRTLLSGIYGRFTEGFTTADLVYAKALLDELSD